MMALLDHILFIADGFPSKGESRSKTESWHLLFVIGLAMENLFWIRRTVKDFSALKSTI